MQQHTVIFTALYSRLGMSGFCASARAEFSQNRQPCAAFGVLCRVEETLPNGTEYAKILLIFVNHLHLQRLHVD